MHHKNEVTKIMHSLVAGQGLDISSEINKIHQIMDDIEKVIKSNYNIPVVVQPKETFICKLCDEEMEVGEQCGYENMSCPNYTGK